MNHTEDMYASVTVFNKSEYAIKDFQISFKLFSNSGTELPSITSYTIYEIVPAKGRKFIREFKVGGILAAASSATCEIEDFEIVQK